MSEFLNLAKLIVAGMAILMLIKLTYVTADYMDRQAALRARATIEAATPTALPCIRHYAKHRQPGQHFTFTQTCEANQ